MVMKEVSQHMAARKRERREGQGPNIPFRDNNLTSFH
jgi:hypothetical protein